jgi:addiction module RelE/StbE family toxin
VQAVIWSPAAVAQLRAIRAYVDQFNPRAAEKVAAHLRRAGDSLEHFPHRGRPVPGTEMRELTTNYPYIIRYRVTRDGTVRILRVRHMSRRPTNP